MSVLDCPDAREVAPEFALGILDGAARDEVVAHVETCATCRAAVAELAETADALVRFAPDAEPPPGFERRVMESITGDARRRRWHTAKVVAAAVAATVIVSVVGVRMIDQARGPSAPVAEAGSVTVPMIGERGERVGDVELVGHTDPVALDLTIDYAIPDGDYRVVLDPPSGTPRALGTTEVLDGHASWSGTARLGGEAATLALVDHDGSTRCRAELPAA